MRISEGKMYWQNQMVLPDIPDDVLSFLHFLDIYIPDWYDDIYLDEYERLSIDNPETLLFAVEWITDLLRGEDTGRLTFAVWGIPEIYLSEGLSSAIKGYAVEEWKHRVVEWRRELSDREIYHDFNAAIQSLEPQWLEDWLNGE